MRIINRYPSVINQTLLNEVRSLALEDLLKSLQQVVPTAEETSPDLRSVTEFIEGLEAIRKLNSQLTALTIEHDTWQKV
jgi:hypothetical protein